MTIKEKANIDLPQETNLDDELDFFTSGMAGTGGTSPFIKDEPEDFNFLHNYPHSQAAYNMHMGQQFGQSLPNNMNPSDMSMQNGDYGQFGVTPQQHVPNSFNIGGNSNIGDDELLDLDLNSGVQHHNFAQGQQQRFGQQGNNVQYFPNQGQVPANRQTNQPYSSTPDGAPIQSPFTHGSFNYAGFGQMQQPQMSHASPQMQPSASNAHSYVGTRPASHMAPGMNRQLSDSRSPMTPRTPGISALHLETPPSGSLPSQPINYHNHQKRTSGQWDSNPDSLPSHTDTPISSPNYQPNNVQISDILKSGKHASLPAKVEPGHHPYPASQTQEAKRRRRRESHNLVERRRRDNINEKIQELSHLVPLHRLEDEKVRKHIMNNSPMSPTIVATGISPPQATSLLAGGGRRATSGSISLGIPPEEKDKGPNKGDILNGSVSWTRDLMWALYQKFQQEDELAELISGLGGQWPFQQSEEEKRMRTELMGAMENNDPTSFTYTRGPGTGLRVPNHTTPAGEPLDPSQMGTISPQSLSPGDQTGYHGTHEMNGMGGHQQFWDQSFKEEDEYGMEMN
ncbi:MAG: hypothetical protein Q9164_005589 [Protoblastenia rupestris]